MARFRRRKPRVVWLPPAAEERMGANPAVTGFFPGYGALILDGSIPTIGDFVTGFTPLVSDIPAPAFQGSGVAVDTLSDIYNSGYRLRRIVGKIFVDLNQPDVAAGECPELVCTVGIIVIRVNQDGTPVQTDAQQQSPAIINNWADPWVFRRSWKLSNQLEAVAAGRAIWPENNGQYGSVADGPHIDQKTARIISSEERLFLYVSATASKPSTAAGGFSLHVDTDIRLVATLRQNAGNRRNASR